MASGVDPFVEDKVDGKVFHCRIQQFFDISWDAVDFVDEKDVAVFEVRQNTDQIATLFKGRS